MAEVEANVSALFNVRILPARTSNALFGWLSAAVLRLDEAQRQHLAEAEREEMLSRISFSTELEDLASADLVVEAIPEDLDTKRDLFGRLDKITPPHAILASNTSYLNVDEIATATKRPGYVLGLHFFSPANVMKLLEIVRGRETRHDVLATCMKLAKTIGKVAVVAGVCDGFIGNRMLSPRQRQVYEAVLRVEKAAMNLLKPGVRLPDYHVQVGELMTEELIGLGLITREDVANQDPAWPAYKKYFMHGTSHYLGLDVHDYGPWDGSEIKEGMVFNVEPGIYIPEEGLGIRIEDDILMTKAGPENLTAGVPKDIDGIEAVLAEA